MILVSMSQDERLDLVAMLFDVGQIRNRDINAEQIFVGKHNSAIDDDHLTVITKDGHIHAELAEPAERDDFKCS